MWSLIMTATGLAVNGKKCFKTTSNKYKLLGNDKEKAVDYLAAWKDQGAAALISNKYNNHEMLSEYFVKSGMTATSVAPLVFERCFNKFIDLNWGIVVVCIDDFNGIGPIFDKLRYFRNERPHVPVIITSCCFSSHDVSCDRLAVCDSSLRIPLDASSLDAFIEVTGQNNRAWCRRLFTLNVINLTNTTLQHPNLIEAEVWWTSLTMRERHEWTSLVIDLAGMNRPLNSDDYCEIIIIAHGVMLMGFVDGVYAHPTIIDEANVG
jgi:hypothetical protein